MSKGRIIAVLYLHRENSKIDIDIPLDISANELIIGLNSAYDLGMDISDLSKCCLKTENPIAFLRGNKKLAEYGLRNGTVINYV